MTRDNGRVVVELIAGTVLGHMGKLHPVENAMVLLLAFGPILLLAVTIVIARRRAEAEELAELEAREKSEDPRE